MEYTTSSGAISMPAHYALVSQEEMVYLEGGALFGITQEQILQFGLNVVANGLTVIGGTFFTAGVSMLSYALIGTTATTGRKLLNDFFSSLNPNQWVALGFATVMAGAYAATRAIYYYNTIIDPLVKAVQQAYEATMEQMAPAAA